MGKGPLSSGLRLLQLTKESQSLEHRADAETIFEDRREQNRGQSFTQLVIDGQFRHCTVL